MRFRWLQAYCPGSLLHMSKPDEREELQAAFAALSPEEQEAILSVADQPTVGDETLPASDEDAALVAESNQRRAAETIDLIVVDARNPHATALKAGQEYEYRVKFKKPLTEQELARRRALRKGEVHSVSRYAVEDPIEPRTEPVANVNPLDHRELLHASKAAFTSTRNELLQQGAAPSDCFGFIFDLNDPLMPAHIKNAAATKHAIKEAGSKRLAIQTGIMTRSEICSALMSVAHRLAGTQMPTLISAHYDDPPIIKALRTFHDPTTLPVVVISMNKLSILGLAVSELTLMSTEKDMIAS